MSLANQSLAEALKRAGYSVTTVRQIVFDLLLEQEPQSMNELLGRAKNKIDRASLYRTINLFERIGIVQKVYIGWKYRVELTDEFSHHHHHLSCLKCGQIIPVHSNHEIEKFVSRVGERYGFQPKRHQFEVYGICARCQNISARPALLTG